MPTPHIRMSWSVENVMASSEISDFGLFIDIENRFNTDFGVRGVLWVADLRMLLVHWIFFVLES